MSRCLVMEAWVYQNEIGVAPDEMGGFTLPGRELPPMTMPQQLLPEGQGGRIMAHAELSGQYEDFQSVSLLLQGIV